jgi:putative spermidine/putrescine transport system permease protein
VDPVRRRVPVFPIVTLLLAVAYFLGPLAATFEFSLRSASGHSFAAYGQIIHDGEFWSTLGLSLKLAAETIVLVILLVVTTAYIIHLRLPRLRPVIAFICILPFVVPPIVLIVGLLGAEQGAPDWWLASPQFLVPAYAVLSLPYAWFSIDAGLRAIDLKTLSDASQSLGAGQIRTLLMVILPSLRTAMFAAALLSFAIVLGEFTMASLALFNTFPTYVNYLGHSTVYGGAALTIFSFGMIWLAMLALLMTTRQGRGAPAS